MKKTLLLHICCGPCSIMPIKYLLDQGFHIIGYFMNPNIHPMAEYIRRHEGAMECADRLGIQIFSDHDGWNLSEWLQHQLPISGSPQRCEWCTASRLKTARDKAMELKTDFFSTSLLYSIYQPHDYMSAMGQELSEKNSPAFFYHDFRKFWQDGINLAREWNIYRQPYCGCIFSESERYQKKFSRLKKTNF